MRGRPRRKNNHVHPLCERLRNIRASKKLTLEKLATKLGYNPYTIGDWERGEMSPTLAAFTDWSEALGCKVALDLDHVPFPSKAQLMASK